jgi:virginiamycin B lyase
MRLRVFSMSMVALLATIFIQATNIPAHAAGEPAALAGQVSSQEEGPMEGVVVSAKRDGSTMTVSVVSDKQGQYSFPASRLDAGHYTLKIRAVGYDLDGAGAADVADQKTTSADLKLRKTKSLALQLTNAEWMLSAPGTEEQKKTLLGCQGCHTLQRIMRSTHDADEFTQVIWRMRNTYTAPSQPIKPQLREIQGTGKPEEYRKYAEYLASVNLNSVPQWEFPLKTLPRPTGRATHVIVTEYDMPRPAAEPHDVIVDKHGMVWYIDFEDQFLGKLDPKTGKTTEFPVPLLRPGIPTGLLDIKEDKSGYLWMGMMRQGALGKFDPATEKFQVFPLPAEFTKGSQLNMLGLNYPVDGKIWTDSAGQEFIYRLDIKTGTYEKFDPLKQLPGKGPWVIYGIDSDSHNNLFFTEFTSNRIGRIDAETKETRYLETPTFASLPRRVYMDANDKLWIAEYGANRIAMLDTKTEKFTEWPLPTPYSAPYHVMPDKNGEVWGGGMSTDRIQRLDTKTGQTIEYLMPRDTNVRRVFVDNSTTPVTFWTGNNHSASIVRVEPLD